MPVSCAFGDWQRRADDAASGEPPVSYAELIDDYLGDVHRQNPSTGCAFSAAKSVGQRFTHLGQRGTPIIPRTM